VKLYEALFILKTSAKEEGIKETIDKVTAEITTAGGKVETVQKMDKRAFARIADKRNTSGFYVNVIFHATGEAVSQLQSRFAMSEDVFRVTFYTAPEPTATAAAAAAAATK
jgi:ribosomal protein S6